MATRFYHAGSVLFVLIIALAALPVAALTSCSSRHEVHEPQSVAGAATCKPEAPVVILAPAVDARPTDVIAFYYGDDPVLLHKSSHYDIAIGPELAAFAGDGLADCLIAKGFCVQRDRRLSSDRVSVRFIYLTLSSATASEVVSIWEKYHRAAQVRVEVRDPSKPKGVFTGNYSSSRPIDFMGFGTTLFGDKGAWHLAQVNKAADEAVKKACDDPAFIAAIAPPLATPSPSSPTMTLPRP